MPAAIASLKASSRPGVRTGKPSRSRSGSRLGRLGGAALASIAAIGAT